MSFAPRIVLNGQPVGIVMTDDTGNYNVDSNPGGWGAPNPLKSDTVRILVAQGRLATIISGSLAIAAADKTSFLAGTPVMVQPVNGKPYDDGVYDLRARIGFIAPNTINSAAGSLQFSMTNASTAFAAAIGFTIDSLDPTILYLIDRTKTLNSTGGFVTTALPVTAGLAVTYYFEAQSYSLIFQNGQACLNRDIARFAESCECCSGEDLDALVVRYAQYTAMLEDFVQQDYPRADALAAWLQKQCYQTGICKPLVPPAVPPGTLFTAPTITMQPQSQSPTIGSNVILSVQAIGTAPLSYQWRKNGVDIPGATAQQLTLLAIEASSGAVYSVIVYNAYGYAISQGAIITPAAALTPVVITAQPQSTDAQAGANVTFSVAATGSATITYQWRKNGTPISGKTASSLTLLNVQDADAANYDCVVSNPVNSLPSTAATLRIVVFSQYGWRDTIPTTTDDIQNLQGITSYVPGQTITADFSGGAAAPHLLIMAEPSTEPLKHTWFVDISNNGNIGDPDNDLFGVPLIIGPYRVYVTVFPTQQALPMQFRV